MYFAIYNKGILIKRGDEVLNDLSWENELMFTPSTEMVLPAYYNEYIAGREEIHIHVNDKVFAGIVVGITHDYENYTMTVDLEHIITEWNYRQISVNRAVEGEKIQFLFKEKADAVREKDGVHICASNFECTPAATDFVTLAGVQAWNDDGTVYPLSEISYTLYTKNDDDYTEISALPSVEDDKTETVYIRFTVNGVPDLYVQVKIVVTNTPDQDNGEIDVNNASVYDQLEDIYGDANFASPGWTINMSDKAANTTIDYVYSKQTKLEALTKTMELTEDLFWRVGFSGDRVLDVSEFGDKIPVSISKLRTGPSNVSIVGDPEVQYEFDSVVNLATVYSEKSDGGMASMTLREVYNNPDLQEAGFPVFIIRDNANNERDYTKYTDQYPKLAPNNCLEYAVMDTESVAMEAGTVIEGSYAFNDLSPFTAEKDDEGNACEVTDDDRINAAVTAYHAAIRKLKQARRSLKIIVQCEQLPNTINVGDKVRFIYDASLYITDACSNYMKKLLSADDWFYITRIEYNIGTNGFETDTVTLEKQLRIDREVGD